MEIFNIYKGTIKITLLIILFVGFNNKYYSQESSFIDNEVLIQISKSNSINEVLSQIDNKQNITKKELLSPHMSIWRLVFNEVPGDLQQFTRDLEKIQGIEIAQVNHILTNRNQPNDPSYSQQWQHFNSGASGVFDADIDTEEAWDITTGGLTANGDTIVVAIIDDGINDLHPDIIDNLWVNHQEIPGNGIDDDANGYIDDYKGWNVDNFDDDITDNNFGGYHGTPVAGIVGAKGNNGIGVSGVNWDVKLMIIVGGPSEARAISSYSYALENRKLYHETAGAKGAFVVATNSSWGINFGQPSQSPLWCAFYDTLGQHGILSAGATINDNQNIDVIGDLPTACPSDYLIAITNTDNTDNKVTFAGFGSTTIDLGAPGEGTYTTSSSQYDGFGGTSGATPHVTGTIALIYSVPCTNLADLAISKPSIAARKVKEYILNGVDSNISLTNITVTGGRLNAFNSVSLAVSQCDSILSIDQIYSETKVVTIFPNPSSSKFNLISQGSKIHRYEIFNVQGQLVKNSGILNVNSKSIYISELPSGIYQLRVLLDSSQIENIRFVKK